jgi:hypothetical protein
MLDLYEVRGSARRVAPARIACSDGLRSWRSALVVADKANTGLKDASGVGNTPDSRAAPSQTARKGTGPDGRGPAANGVQPVSGSLGQEPGSLPSAQGACALVRLVTSKHRHADRVDRRHACQPRGYSARLLSPVTVRRRGSGSSCLLQQHRSVIWRDPRDAGPEEPLRGPAAARWPIPPNQAGPSLRALDSDLMLSGSELGLLGQRCGQHSALFYLRLP